MSKVAAILSIVLMPLVVVGCVDRKFLIRSDPPGATVYLNHDAALDAKTPVEVPFTDHGTYAVRLEKEGFTELESMAEVEAPWWAYPPFDLITGLLWPGTLSDYHEFDFQLEPLPDPPTAEELRRRHAELIERAEGFREEFVEELSGKGR
jgi:PEGA domain